MYLTATIAAALMLTACGKQAETDTAATDKPATAEVSDSMSGMAMSADAKMAKSTGTVTAIDKATGKITLTHAPIPEVSWPAMTMAFTAKSELLDSVAVGDKVVFDVTIAGSAGEVTAISKQ
nr:copper-binding protein [Sphingobium subterraneum]